MEICLCLRPSLPTVFPREFGTVDWEVHRAALCKDFLLAMNGLGGMGGTEQKGKRAVAARCNKKEGTLSNSSRE